MQLCGREAAETGNFRYRRLEIATGLPFTNSESDLDLLITGLSLQQLQEVYTELQAIGKKFQVDIDLETELINGYGIKAAELFQRHRQF